MKKNSYFLLIVFFVLFFSFQLNVDASNSYDSLVSEYLFNTDDDNIVDSSKTRNDIEFVDLCYSSGHTGKSIEFKGNGGYAVLDKKSDDFDSLTISSWIYLNGDENYYSYLCSFSDDNLDPNKGSYFYVVPDTNGACAVYLHKKDKEELFYSLKRVTSKEWHHIAVTLGNKQGRIYIDGELAGWKDNMSLGPSDFKEITKLNYIGKIHFNDLGGAKWLNGKIDDFRIYNKVLSKDEIVESMSTSDSDALTGDMDFLSLNIDENGYINEGFKLPTILPNICNVSWTSSNQNVISNLGVVKYGEKEETVTLLATISKNGLSCNKEFVVKVPIYSESMYRERTLLTKGILYDAYKTNTTRLLSYEYDPDRLLIPFRVTSSMDTMDAVQLGGWESKDCGIRGYTLGFWLSSMAKIYHSTGNLKAKEKADYVVDELQKIQTKNGGKFLSGVPEENFTQLEEGLDEPWVPYYMIAKVLAGLIDMYNLTGNEKALTVAKNLGLWVYERNINLDLTSKSNVIKKEYGGISYSMFDLYSITNDRKYFDGALCFEETDSLVNPLANNINVIKNMHTTTLLPKVIAMAYHYRITKEEKYLKAAENFYSMVYESIYVTGGFASCELFKNGSEIGDYILDATNQTCDVYYLMFLARVLWDITKDVKYLNYYEKALFNHGISCIEPLTGQKNYFQAMSTGKPHQWLQKETCICCDATGAELITEMYDMIYKEENNIVYVNLYTNSSYKLKNGMKITQVTDFPYSEKISLTTTNCSSEKTKVILRIPDWANNYSIKINNVSLDLMPDNGYITIDRVFNDNDKLELSLQMELNYHVAKGKNEKIAFSYGPIALAAEYEENNEVNNLISYICSDSISDYSKIIDKITTTDINTLEFTFNDGVRDFKFRPYYLFSNSTYIIYFKVIEKNSDIYNEYLKTREYKINSSYVAPGETVYGLNDLKDIISSEYRSGAVYATYYSVDKENYVEYEFKDEKLFYSSSVYWMKDAFGVTAPKSWKLMYYDESTSSYVEVSPIDESFNYSLSYGKYNTINFIPVRTKKVKLIIVNRDDGNGTGILQWKVSYIDSSNESESSLKEALSSLLDKSYSESENEKYIEITRYNLKKVIEESENVLDNFNSTEDDYKNQINKLNDALSKLALYSVNRFEVENYFGKVNSNAIGKIKIENDDASSYIKYSNSDSIIDYAPYGMEILNMKEGNYVLKLRIKLLDATTEKILSVDCYNKTIDKKIKIADILKTDLKQNTWIIASYEFCLEGDYDKLEFRCYVYNGNSFNLDYIEVSQNKQEMLMNVIKEVDNFEQIDASLYTEESYLLFKSIYLESINYIKTNETNETFCAKLYNDIISAKNNLQFYIPKYNISFETFGGDIIDTILVEEGNTIECPTDPKKDGFDFVGWYTNAKYEQEYDFNLTVDSNMTLYAKWIEKPVVDKNKKIIMPILIASSCVLICALGLVLYKIKKGV